MIGIPPVWQRTIARGVSQSMAWMMWPMVLASCTQFHPAPMPQAPAEATFLDVDGVHLHYREWGTDHRGQAPTVVMVHGFGSSMESYGPVPAFLAENFHVVAFDLKGFGWSSRPEGDYSPAAHAELLWHALDTLKLERIALVGHSWGASVVLAMTLDQPTRVERLALYSAYVYDEEVPLFLRWAQVGGLGDMVFAMYYREQIAERIELAYYDPRYATQARVDHVTKELGRPGTVAAALAAVRGQRFAAMSRRYQTITAPALVLWGEQDRVTPPEFAHRLGRDLPNARVKTYGSCGHLPMVEARAASSYDLREFLLEAKAPTP